MGIRENLAKLCQEVPDNVAIVAAAKTRSAEEIEETVAAGIEIIGENYVQEAEQAWRRIGNKIKWHFIGHLQRNKVKKAVEIFDMIETLDSRALAQELEKRCAAINKIMPVLIEINIAKETMKTGVDPAEAEELIREISVYPHIKITGLMTMGPLSGNPEDARPYFKTVRKIFIELKEKDIPGVEMKLLSMGMSNSYKIALEEGANMIRIGTKLFGPRLAD